MKPELSVIEGGKVEAVETPERVDFACHSCSLPCVMYPKSKPLAVQHAIPECSEWKKKDTLGFLIKCDVHLHVPKDES
jgi:hypothetical protein